MVGAWAEQRYHPSQERLEGMLAGHLRSGIAHKPGEVLTLAFAMARLGHFPGPGFA